MNTNPIDSAASMLREDYYMEVPYNHYPSWSRAMASIVAVVSIVTAVTVTAYRLFRTNLYWIIFKATALSLSAFEQPYSILPFQTPPSRLAAISSPGISSWEPTGYSQYYAFDEAFGFVFSHNTIFDFILSIMFLKEKEFRPS